MAAMFFITKNPKLALKINMAGLILSSVYLIWSYGAKEHVNSVAENSLINQNISVTETLTGPSPFNTLLWRVIAMTDTGYVEGVYSLLDDSDEIKFDFYSSDNNLLIPISDDWNVKRLQWFTKGFYKVSTVDNKVVITDIRMGVGDLNFFSFVVGELDKNNVKSAEVEKLEPEEFDTIEPLERLWQRIWDENVELFSR
jgi:inner membrane protein